MKGETEIYLGAGDMTVSIPACPETDGIFIPLYSVPSTLRMPYLKLKIQELLLYLHNLGIKRKEQTQYFSQ